ncbi:MAG: phosphate acyltransferase PlsX, partial [Steroidobacteraceae bacterium]|nr:phosphate acyltransferase PlsX [Steroidobacteraceae bacterium]
ADRHRGGLGTRLRPPAPRRPPGHQAGEHPAARRAGAGGGLRHRAGREQGRREPDDRDRHVARDAPLHEPGAGDGRARDHRPLRRLRHRRRPLRDAHRRPAVQRLDRAGDRGAGAYRGTAPHPALELILVGKPEIIEPLLAAAPASVRVRASIHAAASVVGMSDHPRDAIRRRKDSSMRLAIDLVKEGRAQGMVSAGNTGALTAMSHFVLKTVGPVERAPIMSSVPARNGGHTHILDLGANSKASALQLAQFATMGSIVARDVYGISRPRIGLLNIGEEESKGHEIVQEAHELIRALDINYVGFVEGHDIFDEKVDVVVTDGFTGNVALKTMEGLAKLIVEQLRTEFSRDVLSKAAGLLARPVLRRVGETLDPRKYNGACMVGLTGVVVKSHGSADSVAFAQAVSTAATAMRRGLPGAIATALAKAPSVDGP